MQPPKPLHADWVETQTNIEEIADYIRKNITTILKLQNDERKPLPKPENNSYVDELYLELRKNNADVELFLFAKGDRERVGMGLFFIKGSEKDIVKIVNNERFIDLFKERMKDIAINFIYAPDRDDWW